MKSKKELVFCDDCAFRSKGWEKCSNHNNRVKNITPIHFSSENGDCFKINRKNDCKYYTKKEIVKPKLTLLTKIWNKIK